MGNEFEIIQNDTNIFEISSNMDHLFDAEKCDGIKQTISGTDEINCPGCEGLFWCGRVEYICCA